jgi:hypothetical protein
MSIQIVTENTIYEIVTTNNIPHPPPNPDNKFRYYQCQLTWNGLHCKKVQTNTQENTQLFTVCKYVPEQLDTTILKYKYIPNKVIIEDK